MSTQNENQTPPPAADQTNTKTPTSGKQIGAQASAKLHSLENQFVSLSSQR